MALQILTPNFLEDKCFVVLNNKTFLYDKDKLDILNDTKNSTRRKYLWSINDEGHLYTKSSHDRTTLLLELLTNTDKKTHIYSFKNGHNDDYRLENISSQNVYIVKIGDDYVKPLGYTDLKLIYWHSGPHGRADLNIRNPIWLTKKDGNELLVMYCGSDKITIMSVEVKDFIIQTMKDKKLSWYYSTHNGYVISKSDNGAIYLHHLLSKSKGTIPKNTLHLNGDKLDNRNENLWFEDPLNEKVNNNQETEINDDKSCNYSQILNEIKEDKPKEEIEKHNVYGTYKINSWIPLCYATKPDIIQLSQYSIMLTDDANNPCYIKHKNGNSINLFLDHFPLNINGINKKCSQLNVILSSAFPNEIPNETVDHINDDPTNSCAYNLQWMTNSDNCRKGQIKSVRNSNQNGGRNGTPVIMKKPDPKDEKNRKKAVPIATFRNITLAAKLIKDNGLSNANDNKTIETKISRSIHYDKHSAYGFFYDAFNNDLEHEIWKELDNKHINNENVKVFVSNFGRAKDNYKTCYRQNIIRIKYKQIHINGKHYYIHRLVWYAFYGDIPKGMEILHDDTAPLNEDGTYRNYLEDLRLGTRSENMKEHYEEKKNEKEIQKTPFEKFIEKMPSKNDLGLKPEPKDEVEKLMRKPPIYIQYQKESEKRGSKYVIGRQCQGLKTDFTSTTSKKVSDREKISPNY